MATRAQNLDAAIDQVVALIADLTASPKPSYSVEGKSVSWESYLATLTDRLEVLERARQRADNGGAWEVRGRGRT